RLALVQPLVALEPDEAPGRDLGQGLGQLGLAYPRRAFDEHGAPHSLGQEDDGGNPSVGDVAGVLEVLLDILNGLEPGGSCMSELARSVAHLQVTATPVHGVFPRASR